MPRKPQKARYIVKIVRTVEFTAEAEVIATSGAEAKTMVEAMADAPKANLWREGDVVDEHVKITALNLPKDNTP